MIKRMIARFRLWRICRAIGIKPYPQLKSYILNRNGEIFGGGRRNGKTTALIVDELVYKRVPPSLLWCDFACRFCRDPDYWKIHGSERWYANELKKAVMMCESAGIDVGRGKRYRRNRDEKRRKDGYNSRIIIFDEMEGRK